MKAGVRRVGRGAACPGSSRIPGFRGWFAFACAAICLSEAAPVWRNLGPGGGGWIQSVTLDPHDPRVIHIGCDVGGYYQSVDGGRSFHILNHGLTDLFVQQIVVSPADPNVIWLATESGVFKSTDRGRHWRLKRNGFPPERQFSFSAPVGALAVDPRDPNVLYAGIGRPRFRKGGRGRVYRSEDGGETWKPFDGIARTAPDAVIHRLAIRPDRTQTLFAATNEGLFRSDDRAETWRRVGEGLPHRYCRNIAIHPRRPDVMAAVLWSTPGKRPWQGGVYRSDDGGETWRACNDGLPQRVAPPGDAWQKTCNYIRFAFDPRTPDRMYVGANSWWGAGLYRTDDGGRHWRLCTRRGTNGNMDMGWITFWGPAVKSLDVSPIHPDMVVFGDSGRVMLSDDGGETWRAIYTRPAGEGWWQGNGLEVTCLQNVTVDPLNPRRIFCGYADIGILVSEDGGESWQRRVKGLRAKGDVARIVCDPARPDIAWCCEGKPALGRGGVAITRDAGRTWTPVPPGRLSGLPEGPAQFLTLDPSSPPDARRLFVAVPKHGLFRSDDGGRDVRDPRHLILARRHDRLQPDGGLFETFNSGDVWRRISTDQAFPDTFSLALSPHIPGLVLLACRRRYDHRLRREFPGGVWRSTDGGRTWTCVFRDRFASYVCFDPHDPKIAYAGTTRHPYHDEPHPPGFLLSMDAGVTWKPVDQGLTCPKISVITPDPHEAGRVWVGTSGNGLFVGRPAEAAASAPVPRKP